MFGALQDTLKAMQADLARHQEQSMAALAALGTRVTDVRPASAAAASFSCLPAVTCVGRFGRPPLSMHAAPGPSGDLVSASPLSRGAGWSQRLMSPPPPCREGPCQLPRAQFPDACVPCSWRAPAAGPHQRRCCSACACSYQWAQHCSWPAQAQACGVPRLQPRRHLVHSRGAGSCTNVRAQEPVKSAFSAHRHVCGCGCRRLRLRTCRLQLPLQLRPGDQRPSTAPLAAQPGEHAYVPARVSLRAQHCPPLRLGGQLCLGPSIFCSIATPLALQCAPEATVRVPAGTAGRSRMATLRTHSRPWARRRTRGRR